MDTLLKRQTSNVIGRILEKNPEMKYKTISSYSKIFPDFVRIIKYKRPIVVDNFGRENVGIANEEDSKELDYLQKSINRTKTAISDYVLANGFKDFATFTFDPKNSKVGGEENRHDFEKMSKLLQKWLNNEQKYHETHHGQKFKYLIVPERHKNGAWHFHALFEDYKNPTEDFYSRKNPYITISELKSKKNKNRKFLTRFNLGRSELAPIRDKTKMANYIKKYITKELITEPNAKRYWASRNLKKPEIVLNIVSETTQIPEKYRTQEHEYHEVFEIPTSCDYFSFLRTIKKIENFERIEKMKRRWANS